jgi:pimeloyl-ACP methyl ester carboxylesterase
MLRPDGRRRDHLPHDERPERIPRHRLAEALGHHRPATRDHAPTLLLSGRYDEATPLIVGQIHERIPGAQWTIFERSSHMPHVEEPEAFLERVESFLETID